MPDLFVENKKFELQSYPHDELSKAEYDNCLFKGCNFSDSNLSDIVFSECRFEDCNFSLANLNNTSLKDVTFDACKLTGIRFSDCNDFLLELHFEECALNLASFFKLDLKGTVFKNCLLSEADFSETNLTEATFENCDLHNAFFERTNLNKADLRTAYNYAIDPELNSITKARFSLSGVSGLLLKYDIEIE
jgi:fluoroquinolone resistance protein